MTGKVFLQPEVTYQTELQVDSFFCQPRVDKLLSIDFFCDKSANNMFFLCSETEIKELIRTLQLGLDMLAKQRENPVQVKALE